MSGSPAAASLAALLLAAAPVLAQDVTVLVTSNDACALLRGDEEPSSTFEETILPKPAATMPECSAVSATPLCKSCHAFD